MGEDIFGHVTLPSGTIMYWDDDPANIPAGWVICDGNNGTPDLLDDFLKSVDSGVDPGARGGEHNKTLTQQQLPNHSHSTGSTDTQGQHNHAVSKSNRDAAYDVSEAINSDAPDGNVSTPDGGIHSHEYDDTAIGSGNSYDNRPRHHELVPVMKV